MNKYQKAYRDHHDVAEKAWTIFRSYCSLPMPRVPGMDTVIRLAWRIECGRSVEEAAAKEYIYRWNLAVKPFDQCGPGIIDPCVSIFGAPHTIGQ